MKIRGFTLIELMISITILGILVAIVGPAIMSYKERVQDGDTNPYHTDRDYRKTDHEYSMIEYVGSTRPDLQYVTASCNLGSEYDGTQQCDANGEDSSGVIHTVSARCSSESCQ